MQSIEIISPDLTNPHHASAILELMAEYTSDPMGGSQGLSEFVSANLIGELAKRPHAKIVLAFDRQRAVGLTICFEGFSTFACKPLLNIHDLVVASDYRGRGIAKMMLQAVEDIAIASGCCKLTLEVLEGNHIAQKVYTSAGFKGYELDPNMGRAMFWEKKL
jgi:ribosomal protein S18 acetylase RimI-like enzyme